MTLLTGPQGPQGPTGEPGAKGDKGDRVELKKFDAHQYGGAPLLGLKGLVVKTHGSAKAGEVRNSIIQCITFKEQDVNGKIKEYLDL